MDRREDYIRAQRDHNPDFEKFFEDSCQMYKNNLSGFQFQAKPHYGRGFNKKSGYSQRKYSNKSNGSNSNSNYHYNSKPAYYKKNESPQNKKTVNLEEQFIIKTENKQTRKSIDGKKRAKHEDKGDKEVVSPTGQNGGQGVPNASKNSNSQHQNGDSDHVNK